MHRKVLYYINKTVYLTWEGNITVTLATSRVRSQWTESSPKCRRTFTTLFSTPTRPSRPRWSQVCLHVFYYLLYKNFHVLIVCKAVQCKDDKTKYMLSFIVFLMLPIDRFDVFYYSKFTFYVMIFLEDYNHLKLKYLLKSRFIIAPMSKF